MLDLVSTTARIVLPCRDLDQSLAFFIDVLGFRVDAIWPADDPVTAVISGHGTRLKLRRDFDSAPGVLELTCDDPGSIADGVLTLEAPNGTVVHLLPNDPPIVVPSVCQSLAIQTAQGDATWGIGRAGMRYRDLIADRQGGRFIASHICIPNGGPVPDYVHFHKIRFQAIYCYRGWVRVVYEDQGESFVMNAGDCVLQPPRIRHRVLESSDNLEVIEIGCPAEHETIADHSITLPTLELNPDRHFGGQRFVRHVAATALWSPWRHAGFACRDIGIGSATGGLAGVRVIRPMAKVKASETAQESGPETHSGEFYFLFILNGSIVLTIDGTDHQFRERDCVTIPAGMLFGFSKPSVNCELLEVSLPALG